jgi:hypothetical protein
VTSTVPADDEGRRPAAAVGGAVGRDDLVTLALMKLRPGVIYAEKAVCRTRRRSLQCAPQGWDAVTGLTSRRPGDADCVGFRRAAASHRQINCLSRTEPSRLPEGSGAPSGDSDARSPKKDRRTVEVADHLPHPVEDDPEPRRASEGRCAGRAWREVEDLHCARSQSVARFRPVLRVLENWGYVDGWTLTDAGKIRRERF